jgi:hypothetical protein
MMCAFFNHVIIFKSKRKIKIGRVMFLEQFMTKFIQGKQYMKIVSAVTKNDLIDMDGLSDAYLSLKTVKFIPASGAATRMFKDLYQFVREQRETEEVKVFFDQLEKFPFYMKIKEFDYDKRRLGDQVEIIFSILKDKLKYGKLPKAFIGVHHYDGQLVTPIEEHIYESEQYLNKDIHLHFTISEEHESLFKDFIDQLSTTKDHIHISYSFQKEKTKTLAVDMDNEPILKEDGTFLYRAGGHGALIENLNDIDADMIFIKNIDNVCHRNFIQDTVESKKKLASIGYRVKTQIDQYMHDLKHDSYDLSIIRDFIKNTLKINHKKEITKDIALALLNRPLRVCGMVKNQGEPGGGPFIVDNGDYTDLQICEKAEIDQSLYQDIMNQSNYFNPVDLVCFVKDFEGNQFNLLDFVNKDRYFITEKTYKGQPIKALEYPGLWNGAMHDWNTIFVEVPLSTFNPVKTVNDLLRKGHQG